MRRSLAPSALFKRRKLEDGDANEHCAAQGDGLMNHLDKWDLSKLDVAPTEDADKENPLADAQLMQKNYVLNPNAIPLCFACSFAALNKFAKKDAKGEGILVVKYDSCTVFNMESRPVGNAQLIRDPPRTQHEDHAVGTFQRLYLDGKKRDSEVWIFEGNSIRVGTKHVTLKFRVEFDEYKSGAFFLKSPEQIEKQAAEQARKNSYSLAATKRVTGFVTPFKSSSPFAGPRKLTAPLHNPNDPDNVVLFTPVDIFGPNKLHVVVDPKVGKLLRPHQVHGVKFMFECTMGLRGFKGNGCILADDMGLGKTLQAITLIWTLMTQSPTGEPTVKRTLIVCPSSLVGNWCKEFHKWLGEGTIDAIPFGDANKKKAKKALAHWSQSHEARTNVLVASYDQMRIHIKEIQAVPNLDLIVCDEGHRLKNANIKASQALNSLKTRRRVILSGTPIQNDLEEFHAMVDFVNPGVLREINAFRSVFAQPILLMRDPDSSDSEKQIGRERSMELSRLTSEFILRRTAQVNKKYLPPKVDHILFCKLTPQQQSIYREVCRRFKDREGDRMALALMTDMKKLCNSPELIYESWKDQIEWDSSFDHRVYQPQFSGKLQLLDNLLQNIHSINDKVVIVSNYTQTLEVLAKMCLSHGWRFFQLDGSTKVTRRQELVDIFNNPKAPEWIFLLSSKAGGCGLNLVGANHLVMLDPDWNPANDAQAMARVWRPGQQKKVFLYRTLCTGTVEEKIYQRQVSKLALADTVVNKNADAEPEFDVKELRDLFTYREDTLCETHDLLNCRCAGVANFKKIPLHKRQQTNVDELKSWQHLPKVEQITQHRLLDDSSAHVTFVFLKEADPAKEVEEEANAGKEEEVTEVELRFDEQEEDALAAVRRKKQEQDEAAMMEKLRNHKRGREKKTKKPREVAEADVAELSDDDDEEPLVIAAVADGDDGGDDDDGWQDGENQSVDEEYDE